MRFLITILLIFYLFLSPIWSKVEKIRIDGQTILDYIKVLADDSMEGRKSGLQGAQKAEEYIANKFKEWGIEPAGENNTYFQNITIEFFNIEPGVNLEIFTGRKNRKFLYGEDWSVQKFSGSGDFESEIVFVGYGIYAPEKDYNDYSAIDIKDKIVLFRTGLPKKLEKKLKEESKIENRIKAAQKFGAKGALIFSDSSQDRLFRLRLKKEIYKPDFIILRIRGNVVNFIFEDLPTEIRYLFSEIDKKLKPMSFKTGIKARIHIKTTFDEKRSARNILGKITGTDEKFKKEYVIIGAHMDHVGINPLGEIMNGANDNASGTSVVMEIARLMKANKIKPKRTIIFCLWAAEEQGLLGSKYYTEHPLYPLEKTVAYFNFDMVGHGNGKVNFRGIYYGPEIWAFLKKNLKKEIIEYINPGRGGPGGSDHTYFLKNGIPGFFIMTSGFHFKYHRSRDDWDLIKPEILEKTTRIGYESVLILANSEENFLFPKRKERYIWKNQNIINFPFLKISKVLEKLKDVKDEDIDIQFILPDFKEGLNQDELRLSILKQLDRLQTEVKKSKGLVYYTNASAIFGNTRQGKITLIAGLKGLFTFKDDYTWLRIFAKQGIHCLVLDEKDLSFKDNILGIDGKNLIKTANETGILLVISGLNDEQKKEILKASKKSLILISEEIPSKECLDLIKEGEHALGLKFIENESPADYFKKLSQAKEELGSENILIWNEKCLWSEEGKSKYFDLITFLIKEKWEREDLSAIFSRTFLRVLSKTREEGPIKPYAYIPF